MLQVSSKSSLLVIVIVSTLFGELNAVALSEDCSSATCDTGLVCDTTGNTCRVLADGTATGCGTDSTKCPTNAACNTDVCNCNSGYVNDGTGLCTRMTCTGDSACTNVFANTYCEITYPCSSGVCVCSSGYYGVDCTGLGYDQTCSTGTDKCLTSIGLACDSASLKCKCNTSDHSYKEEIGLCTNKNIFGEACPTPDVDTDCVIGDSTNGACVDSKCACKDGYKMEGYTTCRLPYAEEFCTSTCTKVTTTGLIATETSQAEPTCSSQKCVCGSSETLYSRKIGDTCYNVCLTDLASETNELANGQTCTAFKQCTSKVCAKCPGDANAICYSAPCGFGLKIAANGIVFYLFVFLLRYVF